MADPTTLFANKGALVTIHREGHTTVCPCLTPEGFRDPIWHLNNPDAPVCNDRGYLPAPIETTIKGFVQPTFAMRRIGNQVIEEAFGEIQIDDHIGIFPMVWNNVPVDFENWSQAGDEWVGFNDMEFIVVGWTRIPDPANAQNYHHWECALRRINRDGV